MSNENVHPAFKGILDSISGESPRDTLPTSEGDKTIPEIMDCLMWGSYNANRGYGCTHEQLVRFGIGNDAMRERYDWEQLNKKS
jgi:hypothetical protein